MIQVDLALVWAGIIAFAVLAYVVLDGFDLGVGLLAPLLGQADRDRALAAVEPVWDGNETWLILSGGGLFAVFPLAYAVLMPALYPALIAMLLGLIFRGVAFEFRHRGASARRLWDRAFALGSLVAVCGQGLVLGAVAEGVAVAERQFAGGPMDLLTPFTLFTVLGLLAGYALQGAGWLVYRTEGGLRALALRVLRPLAPLTAFGLVVFSFWTVRLHPEVAGRWLSAPGLGALAVLVAVAILATWGLLRAGRGGGDLRPFLCGTALFVAGYAALLVNVYPYMVPRELTIWAVAAPPESQRFLLVGACVLLPIILSYTALGYWVARGKLRQSDLHS